MSAKTSRLPDDLFASTTPSPPPTARSSQRESTPHTSTAQGRRRVKLGELGPKRYASGGRPPAPDLQDGPPPVKVGLVLRQDQVEALDAEVLRRQNAGQRNMERSRLARELLDVGLLGLR